MASCHMGSLQEGQEGQEGHLQGSHQGTRLHEGQGVHQEVQEGQEGLHQEVQEGLRLRLRAGKFLW